MASNADATPSPAAKKAKRMILSVSEKFKIIEDHEKGMTRAQLMDKYGLKKTTVYDILKAKDKIKEIMRTIEGTKESGSKVFRRGSWTRRT